MPDKTDSGNAARANPITGNSIAALVRVALKNAGATSKVTEIVLHELEELHRIDGDVLEVSTHAASRSIIVGTTWDNRILFEFPPNKPEFESELIRAQDHVQDSGSRVSVIYNVDPSGKNIISLVRVF
ncbi:MAG: hypothetical protein K1X63_12165 [Chitinophagales bacterium]|nr:hypothetical protein [Chitinophagales bacterium]